MQSELFKQEELVRCPFDRECCAEDPQTLKETESCPLKAICEDGYVPKEVLRESV